MRRRTFLGWIGAVVGAAVAGLRPEVPWEWTEAPAEVYYTEGFVKLVEGYWKPAGDTLSAAQGTGGWVRFAVTHDKPCPPYRLIRDLLAHPESTVRFDDCYMQQGPVPSGRNTVYLGHLRHGEEGNGPHRV